MPIPDPSELRRILRETHDLDPDSPEIDLRQTIRPTRTTETTPPGAGLEVTEPPPPETGFEIRGELGRGGMNVVYRALQRDLGREVALKRIRPEKERHTSARVDFLREAQLTGALEHPNILPVHGLSVTEKGEISLAMKLMSGTTWAEVLHPTTAEAKDAAARMTIEDHLRTLVAVSNAVSFAHSRGVVHRDLKPENVMLGNFGEVVLMDWGIAVPAERASGDDAGARVRLAGTPAYMAPEMVDPGGQRIGPRTDVYLLGATLFELLEGHPPHAASNLFEALASATGASLPPFTSDAPEELKDICRRAMAHDPRERTSSALAFRGEIERHLTHRESLALSDRTREALAACQAASEAHGTASPEERTTAYGDLARVIAGFEQARVLWPENREARAGEDDARYALAEIALGAGDLVMAQSAANALPAERGRALAEAIGAAVRSREITRHSARRIGAALILLQILVAGFLGFFAWRELEEFYFEETALRLADVNPVVVAALREAQSLAPHTVDPLIDGIATNEGMRITVVAPNGAVLGDSRADPREMANHADRVEIRDALEHGHGLSVRASPTIGTRMVYSAIRMRGKDGATTAIVRTSLPWSAVHASLLDFLTPLAVALLAALALGCTATWLAWRRLDRQVAQL